MLCGKHNRPARPLSAVFCLAGHPFSSGNCLVGYYICECEQGQAHDLV